MAFRNSKTAQYQTSPHIPTPSGAIERSSTQTSTPPSHPDARKTRTEDREEIPASVPRVQKTNSGLLVSARSTSYDADIEEFSEALVSSDSGGSCNTCHQSSTAEPLQSHKSVTQKASSPQNKGSSTSTMSLMPPKGKIIKCSKLTGSTNWLDRSSSIHDLGNLFEEVNQSREVLNKSREFLGRPSLEVGGSSIPLSRTKSVSSLQHLGLARAKDTGLSKSSWELNNASTSPPTFRSLRHATSSNFSESYRRRPNTPPPKRNPALRRLAGKDRLSVGDSVYHTVHNPSSHAKARTSVGLGAASSHSPVTPQTPAFQEDVYYTIQGEAGVTQHYQADDCHPWLPLQEDRRPLTNSSSEEDSEMEEPLYQPLHEWPASEALNPHYFLEPPYSPPDTYAPHYGPTEAYNPHYSGEVTRYSPRSSRHAWHSPSPPSPYYPPIPPKSPKSPRHQRHHKFYHSGHSHYQTYHGPNFSSLSYHPHQSCPSPQCSPQSPQYQLSRACMLHSHPHSPSSRAWPSSPAQLERGYVYSWTVSSCTQSPFGHCGILSLSVWGSCIPHTLSFLSICTPPT